jgi:hypothetical protein
MRACRLLLFTLVCCAGAAGCGGPRVNAANYNKVTAGMPISEVEAILGTGNPMVVEDVELAGDAGAKVASKSIKARSWRSGDTTVVVILFQDDKVVGKLSKGLD